MNVLLFSDLFQQAIQQSGSFLSGWALNEDVVGTSLQLAADLDCSGDNSDGDDDGNSDWNNDNNDDEDESAKELDVAANRAGNASMKECLKRILSEDVTYALANRVSVSVVCVDWLKTLKLGYLKKLIIVNLEQD